MRELAERSYFLSCIALGRLLRSGKYSRTSIVRRNGQVQVLKRRLLHAPLLVRLGEVLMRMLDTGVRVLPQRQWEDREHAIYGSLRGQSVDVDGDATLILPWLPGATLASLLEDPEHPETVRRRAIALAVLALAEFHLLGLTHGDAMAENVLIDLEAGVARWFDFETVHDADRAAAWRRADDLRALIATCLLRTDHAGLAATLDLILETYGDEEVNAHVVARFTSVMQRPLAFHLGQAGMSFRQFAEIARLLRERYERSGASA